MRPAGRRQLGPHPARRASSTRELLADVYINLTRGQDALLIADEGDDGGAALHVAAVDLRSIALQVLQASDAEIAAHEQMLVQLDKASGGKTIWKTSEGGQKAVP